MSCGWVHFVRGRESISIHLVILITQIQCRDPSSKRLFSSLHFIPSLTLCILLLNRKVLPVRRSGVGGRRIRETKPLKDLFSKVFKPHFSTSLAQFPVYFTGCRNSLPTWVVGVLDGRLDFVKMSHCGLMHSPTASCPFQVVRC